MGRQAPAVTITSIDPAGARTGDVVNVVINGTNFTDGLAVGFENGSGSAPVASNVTVLSSTMITATVSIKSGNNRGDQVWDVRGGFRGPA